MIKQNLSIYIADDHTFVRNGMTRLVKTYKRVSEVKEAENGKELIRLMKEKLPDAVILDVEMPMMNGISTAKYITTHFKDVKILVLTMHTDAVRIHQLIENGVHGFLTKDSDPNEVENALYSIIDKDYYDNPKVLKLLRSFHLPNTKKLNKSLTPRQIEILIMICNDMQPAEIAERLQIDVGTYFIHRNHLIKRTSARSNVGLLLFAIQEGYYKV